MTFMMEERRAQREDARELREREKEAEEERRSLELERSLRDGKEREKELQAMSEMIRESLQEDGRRERARAAIRKIPKLTKFSEGDDIEAFLTTFERVMGMSAIEEDRWSCILAPQLAGKAQQAYAAMDVNRAGEYGEVKKMILLRYGVNQGSYRQKHRAARKGQGETYRDLALRIGDLNQKWTRYCESVEEIRDLMNTEQLLEVLPPYLSMWVWERKPTTGVEAGELANEYVEARKSSYGAKGSTGTGKEVRSNPGEDTYHRYGGCNPESSEGTRRPNGEVRGSKLIGGRDAGSSGDRKCFSCGEMGHFKRECPKEDKPRGCEGFLQRDEVPLRVMRCFSCGERGHISTRCPARPNLYCLSNSRAQGLVRDGKVEGVEVNCICIDTGCSQSLVWRSLVPGVNILSERTEMRCVHGDVVPYHWPW